MFLNGCSRLYLLIIKSHVNLSLQTDHVLRLFVLLQRGPIIHQVLPISFPPDVRDCGRVIVSFEWHDVLDKDFPTSIESLRLLRSLYGHPLETSIDQLGGIPVQGFASNFILVDNVDGITLLVLVIYIKISGNAWVTKSKSRNHKC